MDGAEGARQETKSEAILHLHDTEEWLCRLEMAIASAPLIRIAQCREEIDFALRREADCSVLLKAVSDGILPLQKAYDIYNFGQRVCAEQADSFNLDRYEFCIRSFLDGISDASTDTEKQYLILGPRIVALECGIRHLVDYLSGDDYLQPQYPRTELDCCRNRFRLVRDMEEQLEETKLVIGKSTDALV